MEGKGENGVLEGGSDCEDERAKMRPADIDADMREMERRKRVEAMMSSRLFREELERIVEAQMKDGSVAVGPLLQQIQDMMQASGPSRSHHNAFSVKSTNCVIPINDIRGVESMGYAKGEKILRCKLAAVYRLMDLYGWTQGINNHITGRLSQEEELLLVNAYGMLYHEVTASSLVKVDMQGTVVEPGTTNYGVNVQGFHLHAAIHQARPDIKCIVHVHTPSVLAVSSLKAGLLPLSQESVVIGEVSNHHSSGSIQEPEEKDKLVRNLGPINKVMLLSNNGAVCCGETVEEAFFNVYNTVLACESQMKVMPLGVENLVLMEDESRKAIYDAAHRVPESTALPSTTGQPSENKEKRWRIGGLHFEALMRMLDNAGFRTGYIYRTPLVKGEPPKPRSDVEVPPAVSSLGYLLEEEEMYRNWKKMGATKSDRTRWLNSPNVYQKVEILETGTPDPKKITKWVDANAEEWVADGSPTHSSTPVKIADALQFVPKNTNPKEFKKLQQQIKENRRADKITSGPQSHILEGVSWEEAKKLQEGNIAVGGDQVVLVGAASKGIIQREFQHNATVYKTPYAKNPFDSISAQEIEDYKRSVIRKQRGESYEEDQSESEALSSSAALPPSGFKSPPSETDEDSRTEPRVLRIETKTAPIPSQAEYVLSDDDVFLSSPEQPRRTVVTVKAQEVVVNRDGRKDPVPAPRIPKDCPRKIETQERIKCFARLNRTPLPASKEKPVIVNVTSAIGENRAAAIGNRPNKCPLCRHSIECDASSKCTQTKVSVREVEDDDLCTSLSKADIGRCVKRHVVRKLHMDSVIDELERLFSLKQCRMESDRAVSSGGDAAMVLEDSFVSDLFYGIPMITSAADSDECGSTPSDDSNNSCSTVVVGSYNSKLRELGSHIGSEFEGDEFMCERTSPLQSLEGRLDSFVLSDLLSDLHVFGDDDVYITHHTNSTLEAVLVKNSCVEQLESPCRAKVDKNIDRSTSRDGVFRAECVIVSNENRAEEDENLDKNTECRDCNFTSESERYTRVEEDSSKSVLSMFCHQVDCRKDNNNTRKRIRFLGVSQVVRGDNKCCDNSANEDSFVPSRSNYDRASDLELTVEGRDLYSFYEEFDPKEVFSKDSDDTSTEVHYDHRSSVEDCCDIDDCDTVFENDATCYTVAECYTPVVVVNENIITGKKYLMNRYLCGNDASPDFNSCDSLESVEAHCHKDEVCCEASEDSAVFSSLTTKSNSKRTDPDVVDIDRALEWSWSEGSKERVSVGSSESSGIRLSSLSDEEVPARPSISSIDEFVIKEALCNSCPNSRRSVLHNTRCSFPSEQNIRNFLLKSSKSLPDIRLNDTEDLPCGINHTGFRNGVYRLPDETTVRSYYTLVPNLVWSSSSSHPSLCRSSIDTEGSSVASTRDAAEANLDGRGVYIPDEFTYSDTDSEDVLSDSFHFLNNCDNTRLYKGDTNENENKIFTDRSCGECIDLGCNLSDDCSVCRTGLIVARPSRSSGSSPSSRSLMGCLRCFTSSLEESIDGIMSDDAKRNKIICSLKRKFKGHNCCVGVYRRKKCSYLCRNRTGLNRRIDVNRESSNLNHSNNLYDASDTSSSYFSCFSGEFGAGENSDQSKYFSVETDCNYVTESFEDDLIINNCFSTNFQLENDDCSELSSECSLRTTLSFPVSFEQKIDLNTAFIVEMLPDDESREFNDSEEDGRREEDSSPGSVSPSDNDDIDSYLREIDDVSVSSVSCQTDPFYDEPQDVEFAEHPHGTRHLYTIYENSSESSPEY